MTRAQKNAGPEFKGLLCVLLLMHLEAFRSECGQNKERLQPLPSFLQVVDQLPYMIHIPTSLVELFYCRNEKKNSNFIVQ